MIKSVHINIKIMINFFNIAIGNGRAGSSAGRLQVWLGLADQDSSNTFTVSHVDGRQAMLVSVSDFLFGFVSDTDTDTLNICQTKKTQKNSETVMLFRGRLHWLTVYVMRGRERELFLRWSRLDKLPPPRPCGFRAFIGGQHRETLRTGAVLSTFG